LNITSLLRSIFRIKDKTSHGGEVTFDELDTLIGAYFNQDMDYQGTPTFPEAIAEFARTAGPDGIANILRDMDEFTKHYPNDLEAEFRRRWGNDFEPSDHDDQTVGEFFDMVRDIAADPDRCTWYLDEGTRKHTEKTLPKLADVMGTDGHLPSPLSIADTVGAFQQSDKDQLLQEINDFKAQFHNCLDEAFNVRFKSTRAKHFLDMISAIVADPNCYKKFE